jgi:hypothetical protein
VQEKGRPGRLAGCDCDEAWFEFVTVFIVRVAITCYAPFLNASGCRRWSYRLRHRNFFAAWNACGAMLEERGAA